nr:MAG TPA: hypothetical protein [Caudoviricetes sp.]
MSMWRMSRIRRGFQKMGDKILGKKDQNYEDLKADAFEKRAQANDKFNLQMQALGTQSALDQFQESLNSWLDQSALDDKPQGSTRVTDYTGLLDGENPFQSSVVKTGRQANPNQPSLAAMLGTFYGDINASKVNFAEASRPKRTDYQTLVEYEQAERLWRQRYGR